MSNQQPPPPDFQASLPPISPTHKTSTSIFANETSRGPLYQYWRERSRESAEIRARRISDAKERARGRKPLSPEPGPSSKAEYQRRLSRGMIVPPTPAYEISDSHATARKETGAVSDDLPAYEGGNAMMSEQVSRVAEQEEVAESAREEKERLQRQFSEQEEGQEAGNVTQMGAPEIIGVGGTETGKGKGKERKKRIGRAMGNFFGRSFTGYGMKSDGKMNENRW